MTEESKTLGDELAREMARLRDEIMPAYLAVGINGVAALTMMRRDLDLAAQAMARQDAVAMVRALKSLREYQL